MEFECSKSKQVRNFHPISSFEEAFTVVELGVILNLISVFCSYFCASPRLPHVFLYVFMVCTIISVCPFIVGWYGVKNICRIPFFLINSPNSSDANYLPLSDTITDGSSYMANTSRITFITAAVSMDFISFTSCHFEYASIIIRYVRPCTGTAKSTCTLDHGRSHFTMFWALPRKISRLETILAYNDCSKVQLSLCM